MNPEPRTLNSSREPVAVLVQDLFFLSRVISAGAESGVGLTVVKPGDPLPSGTAAAILDLTYPGDWESPARELAESGRDVIAFGPHTDGALMKRARAAGCSRVMAKSKFVVELPRIMARLNHTAGDNGR